MGLVEFGTLNLAISTAYILGVLFLDGGLNLPAIQLLGSEKDHRQVVASSVFTAKLLLYVPMCLVLWVSRFLGSGTPAMSLLLIASVYVLGTNLVEYFSAVTNAFHRMDIEAGLKIFNRIVAVGLGLIAVASARGPCSICAFRGHPDQLHAGSVRRATAFGTGEPDVRLAAAEAGCMHGHPIAGTLIVGTIYLKWDLLVLSYFKISKEQIGWYAGAFEIVEALSALPSLLGAALFPLMVQLAIPMLRDGPAAEHDHESRLTLRDSGSGHGQSFQPAYHWDHLRTGISSGANILAVLIWCIVPIFIYFYLMFVNVVSGYARQTW